MTEKERIMVKLYNVNEAIQDARNRHDWTEYRNAVEVYTGLVKALKTTD